MGVGLFSKLFYQNFVFNSAKFWFEKKIASCLCLSWLVNILCANQPPYSNIPPSVQGKYMNIIETNPWTNPWTSPSAIRHGGLWPHVPFPSRFSFKFILDWINLKLDENFGRDEFIHDSQKCLSFISYASTCYLWNLHNRITRSLSIDPHDIMKCETCSFQFKVLEICF